MLALLWIAALSVLSLPAWCADFDSVDQCLQKGYSALESRNGRVVALLDANRSIIHEYGASRSNQIFEIGSITKTFTGTLLAQAVRDGLVKIDDPIPAEYQKPGQTITYRQLTTHTAGVIATNFPSYVSPNPQSPFAGLTIPIFKSLYAKTVLDSAPGTAWKYSNIGVSLLGLALAVKYGKPYETLVQEKILKPLGMTESSFRLPDAELARFAQGHLRFGDTIQPWSHWDLYDTAVDPAGGLRSTIGDMIRYARANLLLEGPIHETLALAQQPLYEVKGRNFSMGMNWILEPSKNEVWHDGATYGFNSILVLSRTAGLAAVAWSDTTVFKLDQNGQTTVDGAFESVARDCLK